MAALQPGEGLQAVAEACGPASRRGVSPCNTSRRPSTSLERFNAMFPNDIIILPAESGNNEKDVYCFYRIR
jgi:hypothetical protein